LSRYPRSANQHHLQCKEAAMKSLIKDHVVIVFIAAFILFSNLGQSRLWDRDEPRNAGCAAEMLERGDWLVPVFNAELRTHKPVLLYWLMMSAYALWGDTEFAARFWSAVLGIGTVVVTYHIGRRLFNASVGRWAAIVLSTTLMFDVASRAATPDSPLIFFSTLGIGIYVFGALGRKPLRTESSASKKTSQNMSPPPRFDPESWYVVALIYAVLGLGVLAKGPVGLVLPTAVIGMFLLIVRLPAATAMQAARHGRAIDRVMAVARPFAPMHFLRTCWSMRPITALAAAMAVALPWYVWVGMRTDGEWISGFFLEHNFGRAMGTMEGHDGSVLFYPASLAVGFFPWSVLIIPVLIDAARRIGRSDSWRDGYVLAACWVGVYIGLFSFAQTKLPSYITPAYPAMALLTACFLHHWTRGRSLAARFWPRLGFASLCVAGVAIAIAVWVAAAEHLPGDQWLASIGLLPCFGGIAALMFTERGLLQHARNVFCGTAVLFAFSLFAIGTTRVDAHQHNHLLLRAIAARSARPQIAAYGNLEPTWVYYSGQPITLFPYDRLLEASSFLARGPDRFLITTEDALKYLQPELPPPYRVLETVPYFLKKSNLVVIGTTSEPEFVGSPDNDPSAGRR
jgi:4-amino-4-deoxy-L-arabinose transferase-like glycosyltransferase